MIFIKDLGQKKPTEKSDRTYRYGLYKCPNCGNDKEIQTRYIKKHKEVCSSCSATENKNNTKHKGCGTRLYRIWKGIKNRCYNVNEPGYKWYGAKGVYVCSEWRNNFPNFREWALNNGYSDNKVIDKDYLSSKLNIEKCYSPKNCQWITASENTKIRNKGSNKCTD